MHCTCRTLLNGVFSAPLTRPSTLPPSFLLPAFAAAQAFTSSFSTSSAVNANGRKDNNPMRGVSALRRKTGKGKWLHIDPAELPKPVLDRAMRSAVQTDEDHGLWGFFPADRTSMATPAALGEHGRAWYIQELRQKDWHDLHCLWWACAKERNRVLTYKLERERVGNMYGEAESQARQKVIKRTMKAIKVVLTERFYAWENAREAAMQDEEIDMYADLDAGGVAYVPKNDGLETETKQESAGAGSQSTLSPPEPSKPELRL